MLDGQKLTAFVATADSDRARVFYRDALGLRQADENLVALVFDVNGTMLRATTVDDVRPRAYTVLGWEVSDIVLVARKLRQAGIELMRYSEMTQDDLGICTAPGGARVAWFQDPDGNVLSVAQS